MKSKIVGLLLAFVMLSGMGRGTNSPVAVTLKESLTVNVKRAVIIDGVITGGNLEPVGKELLRLASASNEPIDLLIDSPGGAVLGGRLFINYMNAVKAKGVQLRCIVKDMAASMAFQILLHCDERHALANSWLLWHRVRTGTGGEPITAPLAVMLAYQLQVADDTVISELKENLPIDEAALMYHLEQETLHLGSDLHAMAPTFLTVHLSVAGLYEAFDNRKIVRNSQPLFFFGFGTGEIIYIWNKAVNSLGLH